MRAATEPGLEVEPVGEVGKADAQASARRWLRSQPATGLSAVDAPRAATPAAPMATTTATTVNRMAAAAAAAAAAVSAVTTERTAASAVKPLDQLERPPPPAPPPESDWSFSSGHSQALQAHHVPPGEFPSSVASGWRTNGDSVGGSYLPSAFVEQPVGIDQVGDVWIGDSGPTSHMAHSADLM